MRIRIRARLLVMAPLAVALAAGSLTMAGPAAGGVAGAGHKTGAATAAATAARAGGRKTGLAAGNPFCKNLGVRYQASSGAQVFCFGPQHSGPAGHKPAAGPRAAGPTPANMNAASFAEDIAPSGVRGYGQAEVSIAASGRYVVEAWNDSTGFFAGCGAPLNKEETTGFGFSANGGKSFTDLGGLPNPGCANNLFEGDPSVAAYKVGGSTYFYISSLFDSPLGTGNSMIAMDACKVTGSGQRATLACSQPIVLASSTFCQKFPSGPGMTVTFCNFLDKDFLAVDPVHHRLYATFTEFPMNVGGAGSRIELAVCDLGNALGASGPAGGTPASPKCEANAVKKHTYLIVVPADATGCENEGAYPAVDPVTGDIYIGYESNWGTSVGVLPPCNTTPVSDVMTTVPFSCLPLAAHASCGPTAAVGVPIVSLSTAFIPGYSRFPVADFPRVAVSDPAGTVSMVWNDTRHHPEGDILLQSFNLGSLTPVQNVPVVVDKPIAGALNFLPGLRGANASGKLDISWFSRNSVNTTNTNVYAAIGINPRTTTAPTSNILITSRASNWLDSVWDINPNFGDYTDNDLAVTGTAPYIGNTLYIAWSDGRTGVPQPFEAQLPG